MWIEYGPPSWHFLGWAPRYSPCSELLRTPELEKCQSGGTCLIARGVNPTFGMQTFTPEHPQHQTRWFLVIQSPYNKQTSLQKKWSETAQWLARCPFSAISLVTCTVQPYICSVQPYMYGTTLHMTVCMGIFLLKMPCIHRVWAYIYGSGQP